MTERVQVFNRGVSAQFVVHNNRTDRVVLQLAPNQRGWNAALLQVRQNIDVYEQPVRHHDQSFHLPLQQHLQVSLKPPALIMHIGEDRQERGLVEGILDPPPNQGAESIRHV